MPTNADFIAHAFRGIKAEEMPWVAGFPGDPLKVDHGLWAGRPAIPLPGFVQPHHNNFIAVSSFKRGDDGRHHRRKSDFGHMHMVMLDDIGTKIPPEKLALPPSAQVETSPGNYQAWYFLHPPEPDRQRAERLIDGMIANGLTADASDPGMKGVTRYGRLPVGINGKAKYVEKLGAPFVQRAVIWSPQLRYSIDDIAAAYGVDMAKVVPQKLAPKKPRPTRKLGINGNSSSVDGFINLLTRAGLYLEPARGSDAHRIICPWLDEHTDQDPSGTVYFSPSEENDWRGGFKCHHGHCQARSIVDLSYFLNRLQQLAA